MQVVKRYFGLLIGVVLFICSCQKDNQTIVTEFLLGTPVVITVFEKNQESLLQKAFEKVAQIEQAMSTSRKDYDSTEIITINTHSQTQDFNIKNTYTVSQEVGSVIEAALHVADLTQGAFDLTIQPLVSLWGWGEGEMRVPTIQEIEKILPYINWELLEYTFRQDQSLLSMYGQQGIDVGGIAKGYAANIVRDFLVENGIERAILDFGGNIITIGKKSNNTPWKIGIQEPFASTGTAVAAVIVEETAIVTSGIYERYFEVDGIEYSHLLNPTTGYPVNNELLSVSIIGKDSMLADGLSTGVFILGLDRGMEVIEALERIEAVFITKENIIYYSSGLEGKVEIYNDQYRKEKYFNK